MNNLLDFALKYHDFGFNITHINPSQNDPLKKKIFKAPTNDRQILKKRKQTKLEIESLDWKNSTGIGTVLGYNNLRALDIDFQSKYKLDGTSKSIDISRLIKEVLSILSLPENYEWVVKTPSNGFHLIFFSAKHNYDCLINSLSEHNEFKTKAFKPNLKTLKQFPHLGHFELRWDLHLVLPPSTDKEKVNYKFFNQSTFPKNIPSHVDIDKVYKLVELKCLDYDKENKRRGYNLYLEKYHLEHNYIDYREILITD